MRTLVAFIRKHHFFALFLLLEILAFSMLVNSYSYQRTISFNAANDLTGGILNAFADITDYFTLRKQNKDLQVENTILRNRLQNYLLKADTLQTYGDSLFRYIPARVIRNTTHAANNFMVLDKGKLQGVEKEMGVISSRGVAGIVIGVSAHYSLVMSLLNGNAKISTRIKKNNQLVNVIWDETDPVHGKLVDIPAHILLNTGDTIVTSGNSFIFPEGLVVGTVLSYKPSENQGLNTAQITYATDFNGLHHVYLIRNLRKQEELKLLEGTGHE